MTQDDHYLWQFNGYFNFGPIHNRTKSAFSLHNRYSNDRNAHLGVINVFEKIFHFYHTALKISKCHTPFLRKYHSNISKVCAKMLSYTINIAGTLSLSV